MRLMISDHSTHIGLCSLSLVPVSIVLKAVCGLKEKAPARNGAFRTRASDDMPGGGVLP
jgi:hypothetical protein